MGKCKATVEFSLDCEKIWGMKSGIPKGYLLKNIARSDHSLSRIIAEWTHGTLYLAFVMKSLPLCKASNEDLVFLANRGYAEYASRKFTQFETFEDYSIAPNVKLGLHSTCHRHYTELDSVDLNLEISEINKFVAKNKKYSEIFVYPKNLVDSQSLSEYSKTFKKIRVNSASWLYRTSPRGVSLTRRMLRYLDSFFPIFELFCNKRPEYSLDNAIVGTHFFRANLPSFLLVLHYIRIRIGIKLMKSLGIDSHVWSHPHNFGGREVAIKLFALLARSSEPCFKDNYRVRQKE